MVSSPALDGAAFTHPSPHIQRILDDAAALILHKDHHRRLRGLRLLRRAINLDPECEAAWRLGLYAFRDVPGATFRPPTRAIRALAEGSHALLRGERRHAAERARYLVVNYDYGFRKAWDLGVEATR